MENKNVEAKTEANCKINQWYNFGDVNHREHGGIFVKRNSDSIKVVEIRQCENNDKVFYELHSREDPIQDIIELFNSFLKNKSSGIGQTCDWERYIDNNINNEDFAMILSADVIRYSGGDWEGFTQYNNWGNLGKIGFGANYWRLLRSEGIYPHSIKT
jgi:hypothetical protein